MGPDQFPITTAAAPQSNRARWVAAVAALLAAIIILGLLDRRGPDAPDDVAQPLPTSSAAPPAKPVAPAFDLPQGLVGSLFVLGDNEVLTEIDLGSGRSRVASLEFAVERWFVNQVSPLTDVVLVATRRDVYAVDRATLSDQRHVAEGVWVAPAPSGKWAALVPYGSAGGEVRLVDGAGQALAGPPVRLPSGSEVVGVTEDSLVVDAAGTLGLVDRQGLAGSAWTASGRVVSTSAGGVARLVCTAPTACELRAGPLGSPDALRAAAPNLAGPWAFGPGAVLSGDGQRLAFVGRGNTTDGAARVELLDLASGAIADSPAKIGLYGPLPPLAFSPDGKAVVHIGVGGVVLWQPGTDLDSGGSGIESTELPFDADVVALGVSATPPPPPQPAGTPPPSYA